MNSSKLAFASDYDGTLVEGVDNVKPADIEAIRRFQEEGGLFGACSGRALNCVLEPAEKCGFDLDFIVASTGALVLCHGQVVESHVMDKQVVRRIVSEFGDTRLGLHTSDRFVVNFGPTSPNQTKVDSLDAYADEDVYAISINYGDAELAAQGCRIISDSLGSEVTPFQNVGSIDVVPRGCSKGEGLQIVRRALRADALGGIGDSYNDLPLLEAADASYTFPSAPVEVQGKASRIVRSVADALGDFSHRWKKVTR